MTVFYGVWIPERRDAYRRDDAQRPPNERRFWTSDKKSAENKAQHVSGRAIRLAVLVENFRRLRAGELVIPAPPSFGAPAIDDLAEIDGARARA